MLKDYAAYNLWANTHMIELFRNCSEEQLHREIVSSFSSIHQTFLHLWAVEHVWLDRMTGVSPAHFPQKDFTGTTEDVFQQLLVTSQRLVDLVHEKDENWLQTPIEYTLLSSPTPGILNPGNMLHHLFNHQTMHRGQLITMGRQAGITAFPKTDYVFWCREKDLKK